MRSTAWACDIPAPIRLRYNRSMSAPHSTSYSTFTLANDNTHLRQLVAQAMVEHGPNCDLNRINVSRVTDFSDIFRDSAFNGDISQWTPTSAMCMNQMFEYSPFNGDISEWRMPNLRATIGMFQKSAFNGDLSQWSFPALTSADSMFAYSAFNGDISNWDLSGARDFRGMFRGSAFAGDLSQWVLSHDAMIGGMLHGEYKGSLPLFRDLPANNAECRTGLYETMLGGGDKLQMYLSRRPFDHSHAAVVMDIPVRQMWLSKEDFVWLRSFRRTGLDLGVAPAELIAAMVEQYREYKRNPESVSLAGMDLE